MKSLIFWFGVIIINVCCQHTQEMEISNIDKTLGLEHSLYMLNSFPASSSSYENAHASEQRRCVEFEIVRTWKTQKKMLIKCQKLQVGRRGLRKGRSITYNIATNLHLCPRGMRFNRRRKRCVLRFFG